ncbi:MAG TPA: class I SAM-dependent methyltransferase [Phaeodactylibacter sp.]|nr:class I SAM-dependent methyltransferase [Phaeodactylibacter sp.]
MQVRHQDRQIYFKEQIFTTEKYVIPFVEKAMSIDASKRILEIGCGEGGNLAPFLDLGCKVVGIDLNEGKIEKGKAYFETHEKRENIEFIFRDIYKIGLDEIGTFDLIIMRDVIEHIHDQEKFMGYVKKFLSKNGMIFFGFPPWQMPFGGHQQVCKNKIASKLPYYHLLPTPIYAGLLKIFGEDPRRIKGLLEVKETGISIGRFEKILQKEHFKIENKTEFLINPNYQIKFNLTPRKQFSFISAIPYFKNFLTTCSYYLVSV